MNQCSRKTYALYYTNKIYFEWGEYFYRSIRKDIQQWFVLVVIVLILEYQLGLYGVYSEA